MPITMKKQVTEFCNQIVFEHRLKYYTTLTNCLNAYYITVLVDVTSTVLALHLTAKDGIKAGHNKGKENNYNTNLFNPLTSKSVTSNEWDHGTTDHVSFYTRTKNSDLQICQKKRFRNLVSYIFHSSHNCSSYYISI